MAEDDYFKKCNLCGATWPSRDHLLADPEVSLIGYQANFVKVEKGLFLFNHSCQSTLSVKMEAFADMSAGPVYNERRTGKDDCPGYCLHASELRPCPARCECAYVRDVLQLLRKSEAALKPVS